MFCAGMLIGNYQLYINSIYSGELSDGDSLIASFVMNLVDGYSLTASIKESLVDD
jgi:hypothetical protein